VVSDSDRRFPVGDRRDHPTTPGDTVAARAMTSQIARWPAALNAPSKSANTSGGSRLFCLIQVGQTQIWKVPPSGGEEGGALGAPHTTIVCRLCAIIWILTQSSIKQLVAVACWGASRCLAMASIWCSVHLNLSGNLHRPIGTSWPTGSAHRHGLTLAAANHRGD